jgi:hypothetical protein
LGFADYWYRKYFKLLGLVVEVIIAVYGLCRSERFIQSKSKSHTLPQNGQIIGFWNTIVNICEELNIPYNCLVTPSNGYRLRREIKIEMWQASLGLAN